MKKTILILSLYLLATITVLGQTDKSTAQNSAIGKNNAATFGIIIPVGEFAETHFAGVSLGYSWSHHRFGNLETLSKKLIGFTANGNIDYYFGKGETVAGYHYNYGGYLYFRAFGGAIYNPCKKGSISLTTGPTLGIYKGNADAGFGVNLSGSYRLTDKISLAPGIIFLKHRNTASLWSVVIATAYSF